MACNTEEILFLFSSVADKHLSFLVNHRSSPSVTTNLVPPTCQFVSFHGMSYLLFSFYGFVWNYCMGHHRSWHSKKINSVVKTFYVGLQCLIRIQLLVANFSGEFLKIFTYFSEFQIETISPHRILVYLA